MNLRGNLGIQTVVWGCALFIEKHTSKFDCSQCDGRLLLLLCCLSVVGIVAQFFNPSGTPARKPWQGGD